MHGEESDTFSTLAGKVCSDVTVRKSRFKAFAWPVVSEADVGRRLDELRADYPDATHHCYAYIIHRGAGVEPLIRSHDDGEPSGTAGKPILVSLTGMGLTNVLCAVVRYFGGTKLGTGGLLRAYGDAASRALRSGKIVTRYHTERLHLQFPYALTGPVERLLDVFGAAVVRREFGDAHSIDCAVRASRVQDFIGEFRDRTQGKGQVEHV